METWLSDILRGFFSFIDTVLYWLLEQLINLFDTLAGIELFGSDTIAPLADRIFMFLTIIMIFKVSFSIIQFIINPDMFSNSEQGMGKIVKNVVLILIALVAVKPVFNIAYDFQDRIIKSQIIPSLVLGETGQVDQTVKSRIPFLALKSFVVPNVEVPGINYTPSKGYEIGGVFMYEAGKYVPAFGNKIGTKSKDMYLINQNGETNPANAGTILNLAHEKYNYELLLDIVNTKSIDYPDIYVFEYKMLISTATAIFLIIMYLNFCIDLAIRVTKFAFLQLMAPIPIVSMVDPKSSKNGMMSKWIQNCLSTYAGLFIRIAAVNFVIFIIDTVTKSLQTLNMAQDGLITIIVIFGALMFAKELPQLVSDLTGINLKGNFNLNPLKRIPGADKATKTLGKVASTGAAGVAGFAGGVAANALSARNRGLTGRDALGSVLAGGFSSGFRSMTSKEKNPFKAASAGIHGSVEARNLRQRRTEAGNAGVRGFVNRRIEDVNNWAGIERGATAFDKELNAYKEIENKTNDILSRANSEMIKYEFLRFNDDKGVSIDIGDFKRTKEELNLLRNRDTSRMSQTQLKLHSSRINDLQTYIAKTEKLAEQAYVDGVTSGIISDYSTEQMISGLRRTASLSSYSSISSSSVSSGKDIKDLKDKMKNEQSRVVNSIEYDQAQINKRDSGK